MIEAKNTEQEGSNIKCGHFFCLACISGIKSEMKQNRLFFFFFFHICDKFL